MNYKVVALVASAVVFMLIGSGIRGVLHHCPRCPEIVSSSHVERDSVIIHDTVRVVKYAPSITVISAPDTSGNKVITYEVIDTMSDQAVIGFQLASVELPGKRPPDLTHTAWYLAAPDRIKIISDTITVRLPPLQCPSRFWRDVKIGGLCIGIGAVAATSYFILR